MVSWTDMDIQVFSWQRPYYSFYFLSEVFWHFEHVYSHLAFFYVKAQFHIVELARSVPEHCTLLVYITFHKDLQTEQPTLGLNLLNLPLWFLCARCKCPLPNWVCKTRHSPRTFVST